VPDMPAPRPSAYTPLTLRDLESIPQIAVMPEELRLQHRYVIDEPRPAGGEREFLFETALRERQRR